MRAAYHLIKRLAPGLAILLMAGPVALSQEVVTTTTPQETVNLEVAAPEPSPEPSFTPSFEPSLMTFYPSYMSEGLPFQNPFYRNFVADGEILKWANFSISGTKVYNEMPALLISRSSAFGIGGRSGNLIYAASVSAAHYGTMYGAFNQFGIDARATYLISDRVSATVFGRLYDKSPYLGMAVYPYINTSRFGGFMTFMGDNVGVDLGVERYFDPFCAQWVTAPIVTPKFRIGSNAFIEIPVGGMIRASMGQGMPPGPPPPPPAPRGKR